MADFLWREMKIFKKYCPNNYTCARYVATRDKTMDDKLMYFLNVDEQNYPLCRLKLLVLKSFNQSMKIRYMYPRFLSLGM